MDKTIDVGARTETEGIQGIRDVNGCEVGDVRRPGEMRQVRALVLAAVLALLGSPVWAGPSKVRFDVKSDDFPKAIIEFYRQSNIEVAFPATDEYKQIRTNPVAGELDPRDALEQMLKGTGLQYYFDSEHSVVIAKNLSLPQQANPAPEPSAHHLASAVTEIPLPQDPSKLEQVVVTGSLIHGVFDVIAPLVYVSKQQLQQAPYATVQDALYALPMNSLNGPREDVPTTGNLLRGAGINLRGLGSGATLVLVNGHRQPMSGFNGDFVDVSNIPWTAVERIEVLPDGASALYGSDAIAGVVNIILRDNVQGAETQTRFGEAVGGANEKLLAQIFGTRWSTGRVMLTYQYSERTSLDASDRTYAANADKTSLGGSDYRTYYGNPANILDPATLQPLYGVTASGGVSSTLNYENQFARFQLFPQKLSHNLFATVSQRIGEKVDLFAEGRFSQRDNHWSTWPNDQLLLVPRTNPYFVAATPGAPFELVGYSFSRAFGPELNSGQTRNYIGTIGLKYSLAGDWQASLSETYGHETLHASTYNEPSVAAVDAALALTDPALAFNPFGSTNPATLALLHQLDQQNADSGIQTWSAVADGSLFSLPGGIVKLAFGAEHRQETFSHWSTISNAVPFGRTVNSAFAELALPLLGDRTNPRAAPRVELTFAGRYENYSDFGATFNPQVRLRWIPFDTVKLRGSWGSSFRAPKLVDLYDTSNNAAAMAVIPDPRSSTGRSLVLAYQGTNPNLKQETADTWTAGIDWVPAMLPGFNLSLTYYAVDYEGRIVTPGPANPYETLLDQNEWAPIITRNPTQRQIAAVCNSPRYQGSVSDCLASSPAAIIDFRLANLAASRVNGLDLEAVQSLDNSLGHFRFGLNGSYVFHFDQAVTSTSPSTDIRDMVGNPLALRLRATAGWSEHRPDMPGLGVNLALNHTGGYNNSASALVPRVAPWTTLDVQVRYRTPRLGGWLSDTELSLNAVNLFNRDPPFVDNEFGYDIGNVQPLGRVISAYVRKNW